MTYPRTAEYGQVTRNHWPVSRPSVIEIGHAADGLAVTFEKRPIGYECAGSAMRFRDHEGYAVHWSVGGCRHGRQFRTWAEAFEFYTNRIRN